jgi:hypothetical protein
MKELESTFRLVERLKKYHYKSFGVGVFFGAFGIALLFHFIFLSIPYIPSYLSAVGKDNLTLVIRRTEPPDTVLNKNFQLANDYLLCKNESQRAKHLMEALTRQCYPEKDEEVFVQVGVPKEVSPNILLNYNGSVIFQGRRQCRITIGEDAAVHLDLGDARDYQVGATVVSLTALACHSDAGHFAVQVLPAYEAREN